MKSAIVMGGGTGVGASTSVRLAALGYAILVNYRHSVVEAREVVRQCQQLGVDAYCIQGDIGEDEHCRRIAASASERWGCISALVNCAGVTRFVAADNLDGLSAEDFIAVYRTNTIGAFQMARAVVPAMRTQGGAIVNISSIASLTGNGSSYAYVASKAALNALTLGLARTLAPAVRVNAVLAGLIEGRWVRESLGEAAYERIKAEFRRQSALGTVCTPDQIADAAIWLVDGTSVVTGQLMVVDAGSLLGRPPVVSA
jgi:3-oxoacyl-[acyl-carrier protein] reductase